MTTVDATNLLDAKRTQAVRKKSLLKKEKRYRIRPAYSATRKSSTLGLGGNARWRNGLSRDLPATRAARSGDGIQEKAKKLVVGRRGDIIGRSTDRHQGSFPLTRVGAA